MDGNFLTVQQPYYQQLAANPELSQSILKRKRSPSSQYADFETEPLSGSKSYSLSPGTPYGEEVSTPATTVSVEIPYVPAEAKAAKGKAQPKASTSKSVKGKGKAAAAPKKQSKKPAKKQTQKARAKAAERISRTATPEYLDEDDQQAYQPQRVHSHAYDPDNPVDDDEEDDRLYCICQQLYDPERMMIACDRCDNWYHTDCIKIDEVDVELVNDFICPKCEAETDKRTTWKSRCVREGCNKAQVSLSKYCSDWCGIEAAAARLEISGIQPQSIWTSVSGARKRKGLVLDGDKEISRTSSSSPKAKSQASPESEEIQASHLEQAAIAAEQKSVKRELHALTTSQASVSTQQESIQSQIQLLDSRLAYLNVAIKNWEDAVAAHANASSPVKEPEGPEEEEGAAPTNKKNKRSKKKAQTSKPSGPSNEAPCGFDVRLIWDDSTWSDWVRSSRGRAVLNGFALAGEADETMLDADGEFEEEIGLGWQRLNEASFEAEKTVLARKLERLASQEASLQGRVADVQQYSEFLTSSLDGLSRSLEQAAVVEVEDNAT